MSRTKGARDLAPRKRRPPAPKRFNVRSLLAKWEREQAKIQTAMAHQEDIVAEGVARGMSRTALVSLFASAWAARETGKEE